MSKPGMAHNSARTYMPISKLRRSILLLQLAVASLQNVARLQKKLCQLGHREPVLTWGREETLSGILFRQESV